MIKVHEPPKLSLIHISVIKYAIKQGRKFKTPIEGTPSGQLAFAVKKGENPELIEMFNNGLANLKKSGPVSYTHLDVYKRQS